MIAKIVKGQDFGGVINYILDEAKGTQLLDSDGIRLKDKESIIRSFVTQVELNTRLLKPVGHISLSFSSVDKDKLSNELMVAIAKDYMAAMGIINTQYLIGRHFDKAHPHIHIAFNRVDNDGKTISDKNDRFRSEKICKMLTQEYSLYFAKGKERVNDERLREPDRTKYWLYCILKKYISRSANWTELENRLRQKEIGVHYVFRGNTTEIQGVVFTRNGYSFSGSKVGKEFSYSKIDARFKQRHMPLIKIRGEVCTQQKILESTNENADSRNLVVEREAFDFGGCDERDDFLKKKKSKKGRRDNEMKM